MHESTSNPYRPPVGTEVPHSRATAHAFTCSLAGTVMVLAIAITLWTLSIAFLDRLVPPEFDMALWSTSLLCSLTVAAIIVARTDRFRPRLIHLALAAIVSIGAYAWLEGQADNAGGSLHAALFYVTAVLVPATLLIATALTPNHRNYIPNKG